MAEEKKETGKKAAKKAAPKKAPPKREEEAIVPKEEPKKEVAAVEAKPEPKKDVAAPAEKKPKRARKAKKKVRVEHARGKRKEAIARATVKEGSGRVRINSRLTSSIGNRYFREIVEEPLALVGPEGLKVDVSVRVHGGGEMGQAQACRTAIAKALVQYFGESVSEKYKEEDKFLLREDPRRVEPKKYLGPKARARDQKSYR